ncbi:hypothetical protein N9M16_01830 [Candidatus Dependentiae bacterium]|nr:hypothetical protein [Candidatus Dependentiae bacterium]
MALTCRFAGSAPTRRREYRRAAAGIYSCHVDARVTRRAPHAGVSSRARAEGPAFRARHPANTAF